MVSRRDLRRRADGGRPRVPDGRRHLPPRFDRGHRAPGGAMSAGLFPIPVAAGSVARRTGAGTRPTTDPSVRPSGRGGRTGPPPSPGASPGLPRIPLSPFSGIFLRSGPSRRIFPSGSAEKPPRLDLASASGWTIPDSPPPSQARGAFRRRATTRTTAGWDPAKPRVTRDCVFGPRAAVRRGETSRKTLPGLSRNPPCVSGLGDRAGSFFLPGRKRFVRMYARTYDVRARRFPSCARRVSVGRRRSSRSGREGALSFGGNGDAAGDGSSVAGQPETPWTFLSSSPRPPFSTYDRLVSSADLT
ncbi:hypothetical protein THAOC_07399 [Thalassiosira oceanica]|uniref:Uncharacterized protein n=1 Tax=Thalassiosira oceanica TaxID=159749 RepID=K0TKL4_THAOC|nr:hypothetical protein THAOC_07399 [Thalassiosira oceanica]|eukprot:EJK71187.1 hypothetical protein THAOC_07399 [Thalassiosira oceanica]